MKIFCCVLACICVSVAENVRANARAGVYERMLQVINILQEKPIEGDSPKQPALSLEEVREIKDFMYDNAWLLYEVVLPYSLLWEKKRFRELLTFFLMDEREITTRRRYFKWGKPGQDSVTDCFCLSSLKKSNKP